MNLKIDDLNTEEFQIERANVLDLFSKVKYILYLEGQYYEVNLQEVLKTNKDFEFMSDNDLAQSLEKITAYITTCSASEFELKNKLSLLKIDYDIFAGKVFNQIKQTSERTVNEFILKQNLCSLNPNIINENKRRTTEINELNLLIEEIMDLKWNLKERVKILTTLIEKRYFVKGGKFHERSY